MRLWLYGAAALALACTTSPDTFRSALASAASALVEASPFVLASVVLSRLARRSHVAAYAGCGCTSGPSARSLPATVATWIALGPLVAVARFVAAVLVAKLVRSRECARDGGLLGDLHALLPAALLAGATMQLGAMVDLHRAGALTNLFIGAIAGASGPCALGSVALAGALHARAPIAAAAFLCIAGIVDVRAFARSHPSSSGESHDAFAYAVISIALGIVAWRHGAELVRPSIAGLLAVCCVATLTLAVVHRTRQNPRVRIAPIVMLAGALIAAPPPAYRATETTLSDLFSGERLSFTGVLTRDNGDDALVRYAITCCRADAAPVAVRLVSASTVAPGSWVRAAGTIERVRGELRLRATAVERIAPPADPFVYR